MTEDIERTSVTLPPSLLADVDDVVATGEYESRSEAVRDALWAFVTEIDEQRGLSGRLGGTVLVLYEHDVEGVTDEVTALQHEFGSVVVASHHVHLREHVCLESIVVDGAGERIERLLTRLRGLRGVRQVELTVVESDDDGSTASGDGESTASGDGESTASGDGGSTVSGDRPERRSFRH